MRVSGVRSSWLTLVKNLIFSSASLSLIYTSLRILIIYSESLMPAYMARHRSMKYMVYAHHVAHHGGSTVMRIVHSGESS